MDEMILQLAILDKSYGNPEHWQKQLMADDSLR
jgi:hypothetical protein